MTITKMESLKDLQISVCSLSSVAVPAALGASHPSFDSALFDHGEVLGTAEPRRKKTEQLTPSREFLVGPARLADFVSHRPKSKVLSSWERGMLRQLIRPDHS
jgi:hypothetical protein